MFRKILQRRLNRQLNRAVRIGAITQEEAEELGRTSQGLGFDAILELILMIIELIRGFLSGKNMTYEEAIEAAEKADCC